MEEQNRAARHGEDADLVQRNHSEAVREGLEHHSEEGEEPEQSVEEDDRGEPGSGRKKRGSSRKEKSESVEPSVSCFIPVTGSVKIACVCFQHARR